MTCSHQDEYDNLVYYETFGIGYVFMTDSEGNLHPVQDGEISVTSTSSIYGSIYDNTPVFSAGPTGCGGSWYEVTEKFYTNNKGCYEVRFVKSIAEYDYQYAKTYYFNYNNKHYFRLSVEDVKNAENRIVLLDTIKF
jgi:hypothetical protein